MAFFSLPIPFSEYSAPVDEHAAEKKKIFDLATLLREEVSRFLEQQVDVQEDTENPTRPRLPIFFVKGFNALKSKEAALDNYKCPYLNVLPYTIQMQLLTEFGPSEDYPKLDENGCFIETPKPVMEEVEQLEEDLIDFVTNHYICTGDMCLLPSSLYPTMKDIANKLLTTEDEEAEGRMFSLDANVEDEILERIGELLEDNCIIRMLKRCFNL
ncbi:hypothetical protein GCK72_008784 [Caenorhabditis remanei]|uniref:Uncharacterized protein n=1 Tax=Caenorhabditis remanei TaxID=31234 RepID=A0A6A5H0X5_CAERE|nr:hypothetical protein GCK72_008784 [Caenorhabditis remanei]KAF1760535.1 hypothetical protein GCK72_008784 [Caenorhabditis remanei]